MVMFPDPPSRQLLSIAVFGAIATSTTVELRIAGTALLAVLFSCRPS